MLPRDRFVSRCSKVAQPTKFIASVMRVILFLDRQFTLWSIYEKTHIWKLDNLTLMEIQNQK
jgi:hypothetical protein